MKVQKASRTSANAGKKDNKEKVHAGDKHIDTGAENVELRREEAIGRAQVISNVKYVSPV